MCCPLSQNMHPEQCQVKEDNLFARFLSNAKNKTLLLSRKGGARFFNKRKTKIHLRDRTLSKVQADVLKSRTWTEEEEEESLQKHDEELRKTWGRIIRCLLGKTRFVNQSKLSSTIRDGSAAYLDTKGATGGAHNDMKIKEAETYVCYVCGDGCGNLVRFPPYKTDVDRPLHLSHWNEDIQLHHVCVNSPDLQFLSEASIRKVYGYGSAVNLALAETRSSMDNERQEFYFVEEFEAFLSKINEKSNTSLIPSSPLLADQRLNMSKTNPGRMKTEGKSRMHCKIDDDMSGRCLPEL